MTFLLRFVLLLALVSNSPAADSHLPVAGGERQWPQAGGPHGTWAVEADSLPVKWSVARGEGVLWRITLPETGQGGIAVWGNRVFLTTLKPEVGKLPLGRDIIGHCLDAKTGKILWTVTLPGRDTSVPAYFFSDATSPSPVTDGQHVWFFNACGSVGCFDFAGKQVWLREWQPTGGRPFNKQFEPILFNDALLNMEPRDADDPKREGKDPWNYLRALDKRTGRTLWVAEDAMTHYNTPVFGRLADGTPAVLQGRGAYHGVPELPVGLSLTSLAAGKEGKTLWRFETNRSKACYTMHWNAKYAAWFDIDASEHQVLDAATGRLLRTQSLVEPAADFLDPQLTRH
ncbi:MAG: PQQ-binding-like beta-propeller repeat protein [Limisphaerales bacterium]